MKKKLLTAICLVMSFICLISLIGCSKDNIVNPEGTNVVNTGEVDPTKGIKKTLCNPEATNEAKWLYEYFLSIYGKKVISGQQTLIANKDGVPYEMDVINTFTNEMPMLAGFDIGEYVSANSLVQLNMAKDWAVNYGGIVDFMFCWYMPAINGNGVSFENNKVSMKVEKAVIAGTDENKKIMGDLKKAGDALQWFYDEHIPVIFRPLHEADINYFWWSNGGPEGYKKLYDIVFNYLVNERHLDNLIWVWNGQSRPWLVDENKFDISGMDIYPRSDKTHESQINKFNHCKEITPDKMVTLSECEFIPYPNLMMNEGATWLWYMCWFASYIYVDISYAPVTPYELNEKYISENELLKIYASKYHLSLSDYPGNTL